MMNQSRVQSPESKVPNRGLKNAVLRAYSIQNCPAFTLVEVMVVSVLMALIVLALMAVFNSTQAAFRAGITQNDVLEGGRATADLMKSDLEAMTPSFGTNNGAVNFYVTNNPGYVLIQSFPGSVSGSQRTNVLENFFVLTRQNRTWTGVGYVVDTGSYPTNPLYRFSMSTNVMASDPWPLFNAFTNWVFNNAFTNMSHLMDGVVDLRVRAYDTNGTWMNDIWANNGNPNTNIFKFFLPQIWGETGLEMFSNAVPASVEVELGVLEDRTLQRVESLPNAAQLNYLSNHAGQVHVFRQRVWIRNVDPSAY
jgi:type II secretory pathway pseudopilin PulG